LIKATIKYNLGINNEELTKEWHPTKNGSLHPCDVTPHSGKKVWWICNNGHEWKASVDNRSKGKGCAYCIGKLPTNDNNLEILYPELSKEWHLNKNLALRPCDVTSHSGKKVWWICNNGHEWKAIVASRANGNGCPGCNGKMITKDNNLAFLYPHIAKEWHPIKNGNLKPYDVTPHSNKKAWWICSKGHEWKAIINGRLKSNGCLYCSRILPSEDYNLEKINPILAKEWHPVKNGNLKPCDVTPYSNKKVWWLCNQGHEWIVDIYHRTNGNGCKVCNGRVPSQNYNLEVICPEIAKQWHSTKNGILKPRDVTPHSEKRIWWVCNNGHEWEYVLEQWVVVAPNVQIAFLKMGHVGSILLIYRMIQNIERFIFQLIGENSE
jgi:hypothetical protein